MTQTREIATLGAERDDHGALLVGELVRRRNRARVNFVGFSAFSRQKGAPALLALAVAVAAAFGSGAPSDGAAIVAGALVGAVFVAGALAGREVTP